MQDNTDLKFTDISELPPNGQKYVADARKRPWKKVETKPSVSITHYPSKKNGCVIQCASRTVEFPSVIACEFDNCIPEYYEQAPPLKIKYISKSGRTVSTYTTPDMCYYHTEKGWVIRESKHRDLINSESEKSPNRYVQDRTGNWTCPPGMEAAKSLGMQYEVFMPSHEDEIFHRNCRWLEDYFFEEDINTDKNQFDELIEFIKIAGSKTTLQECIEDATINNAIIYRAIATRQVYFDLNLDLLCRPLTGTVYLNKDVALAWRHIRGSMPVTKIGVDIHENSALSWEGKTWKVKLTTDQIINLVSGDSEFRSVSIPQIQTLIDEGHVRQIDENGFNKEALNIINSASPSDIQEANTRADVLAQIANGKKDTCFEAKPRTIREWKKHFKKAEIKYGCGFLGLIPKNSFKGGKPPLSIQQQYPLIDKALYNYYLSEEAMSMRQAYALFKIEAESQYIEPACVETFINRGLKIGVVVKIKNRNGRKASYQKAKPLGSSNIPVHGDRPWETAHLDHTQLDIWLKSKITGQVLGKPWASLLVDADSREILARYLSFQRPSKIAVMMVLRDCVWRHRRLPQSIVVDKGAEFHSIYTDTLFASAYITKVTRPSSEPKFGSIGERFNGTLTDSVIDALRGNNKGLQKPRSLSKSHDPRLVAVWNPDEFINIFDEYLFEIYPNLPHHEILEKPRERFERGIKLSGDRPYRHIPYDQLFLTMTMPEPKNKPTRKIHHYGIGMNSLRYWGDCLEDYVENKKDYFVKCDPHNLNQGYIYLNGKWERLLCTSPIIREYNESKIDNSFIELMARAAIVSKDYRSVPEIYARFIMNCKKNEELLIANKNLISDSQNNCQTPPDHSSSTTQLQQTTDESHIFEEYDSATI